MQKSLEFFVRPYYEKKDIMHNFEHIKRLLKIAKNISKKYNVDESLLEYGACFHGFIYSDEKAIISFLKKMKVPSHKIKKILQVSWESQKDEKPKTIEGTILHDAHLLEGGKTYIITKCLVTGTARGQNLNQTISYIEEKVLGKLKCYLPKTQKEYLIKEKFARDFIKNLKQNL